VRAGASPSQKGTVGAAPPASMTRTVPTSTLRTRQAWVPSRKTSPMFASTAKSSWREPSVTPSGVEHDPVVAGLGDGPAARQRSEPRTAPGPEPAVHRVVVEVRPRRPRPVEIPHETRSTTSSNVERSSASNGAARRTHRIEGVHLPSSAAPPRPQLLGEHVEGGDRWHEHVEVPGAHAGEQGRALDELVASEGVDASGRRAFEVWLARPTRWRKVAMARGDPIWQTSSTDPRRCRARATRSPPARADRRRATSSRRACGVPWRDCRGGRPRAGPGRRPRRRRPGRPPAARPAGGRLVRRASSC